MGGSFQSLFFPPQKDELPSENIAHEQRPFHRVAFGSTAKDDKGLYRDCYHPNQPRPR